MRQHDGLGFRHPELASGSLGKGEQSSNPGDADMRGHDGSGMTALVVILNLFPSS